MMRSMFSGVSGIQSHVTMMDLIGSNISNINTVGYKSSRMTFQEMIAQTLRGPAGGTADLGGTNGLQVGLGASLAAIDANFGQGSLQVTGRNTDVAIQGAGFFNLKSGNNAYYSRAGGFSFDKDGTLVNPSNGFRVQGWVADANGNIDNTTAIADISLGAVPVVPASATTQLTFGGNLDAGAASGTEVKTQYDAYNSLGEAVTLAITFTKSATTNQWSFSVVGPTGYTSGAGNNGTIGFDTSGRLNGTSGGPITFTKSGIANMSIAPDFGTVGAIDGLTQFADISTAAVASQDGYGSGALRSYTIGGDGTITGVFTNGQTKSIGQLALTTFRNPAGLTKSGDSMFTRSSNSGDPVVGVSGTGERGQVVVGALEMSNVDLASEFTAMIVAQRGFQANSRIVSSVDEMLQDLVNLKR